MNKILFKFDVRKQRGTSKGEIWNRKTDMIIIFMTSEDF
jgi:hypothetical protein